MGDIQPPGRCFESQWLGLSSVQTHGRPLTRPGLPRGGNWSCLSNLGADWLYYQNTSNTSCGAMEKGVF